MLNKKEILVFVLKLNLIQDCIITFQFIKLYKIKKRGRMQTFVRHCTLPYGYQV